MPSKGIWNCGILCTRSPPPKTFLLKLFSWIYIFIKMYSGWNWSGTYWIALYSRSRHTHTQNRPEEFLAICPSALSSFSLRPSLSAQLWLFVRLWCQQWPQRVTGRKPCRGCNTALLHQLRMWCEYVDQVCKWFQPCIPPLGTGVGVRASLLAGVFTRMYCSSAVCKSYSNLNSQDHCSFYFRPTTCLNGQGWSEEEKNEWENSYTRKEGGLEKEREWGKGWEEKRKTGKKEGKDDRNPCEEDTEKMGGGSFILPPPPSPVSQYTKTFCSNMITDWGYCIGQLIRRVHWDLLPLY